MIHTPEKPSWWKWPNEKLGGITNKIREKWLKVLGKEGLLWEDVLLDRMTIQTAENILSSSIVKKELLKVKRQWTETKIPNIGNYDLWSTIRDEFRKITKIYRKYREWEKEAFEIFKNDLKNLIDEGFLRDSLEKHYKEIEDAAGQKNIKKFILRARPLVESLVLIRIIDREKMSQIRNNKHWDKFIAFKEWNPIHYDIIWKDEDKNGVFVPKNSIEIHIEWVEKKITKSLLESFWLIRKYLEEHTECPGIFMHSWLVYLIMIDSHDKQKNNIAKRFWLNESNTKLDQKTKLWRSFVKRDIFLANQTKKTISQLE